MKLSTKLTLFISGSKLAVVVLFILMLPFLVKQIASEYANYNLRQHKRKVILNIERKGLDYYLQGDTTYGSYTMLKEEYIAIEQAKPGLSLDTVVNSRRVIIENDTLDYRLLSATFKYKDKNYLLEIGKATTSINQYNKPLQRFALFVLLLLVVLTILIDLTFTSLLIKPLSKIIKTKLTNRKFPFTDPHVRIKTSTKDFKYLDESLISLMDQVNETFVKEREFTANASHELMTPIAILQSKMENLLGDVQLNEQVSLSLIGMMKTLGRLKKISNSLLLISRIENEQFIKSDHVRPLKLFNDIIEEIEHKLEENNISIKLNISEEVLLKNVSQDLLFQLFYNLINNAIKFNKTNGYIYILGRFIEPSIYEISIGDTGIGIPEDQLLFIFDRFRKNDLSENQGHGLGLAIVKSIAIYHHLELSVKSKLNEGTTFKIIFDL